jgi:hypothetical protein
MTMVPPRGLPPRGPAMPPQGLAAPPGSGSGLSLPGGLPGGGGAPPMGGGAPPIMQAIMRFLPPQVVQAVASNPAIIPRLVQTFMPMVLGSMRGAMPPGGGGGAMPPRGGGAMPPRGFPPRRPPPRPGVPPGAFTGNGPPPPPAQGAIGAGPPMSTEDELEMTRQNMGSKGRNA